MAPIEPPECVWQLVDPARAPEGEDLLALGADLAAGTLLAAYRSGLFPMGVGERGGRPLGWWSPSTRGVLRSGDLRVSKSLRRSMRNFEVRVDTAFTEVLARCADPDRPEGWITDEIAAAYTQLHDLGWAHSVEAWQDGELAGGLYGVAIGGLFAGESMFSASRDASKVALVGLVESFFADGDPRRIIDTQWVTAHLASLGVQAMPRADYLARLTVALTAPHWHPR